MLTDLVQIKRFGEKQRDDNKKFRAWLKRHNFVERRLKIIAQDIEDKIDCTACANCCRIATIWRKEPRAIGSAVPPLTTLRILPSQRGWPLAVLQPHQLL